MSAGDHELARVDDCAPLCKPCIVGDEPESGKLYSKQTGSKEDLMRDHWWWRPGWRLGRRAYTFHITFEDPDAVEGGDDLRRMATEYQGILATLPGLDLVPLHWLHLTMQNVGFTDEVPEASADAVLAAGRKLC